VPGRSPQPISVPPGSGSAASTGEPGFDALREIVLADPVLQARLRETYTWDRLVTAVEQLAPDLGIDITRDDLLHARRHTRRVRAGRAV
jgi:hypothetical protein